MPYKRRSRRRGMNLARPKLASQVGIWTNPQNPIPNPYPKFWLQRFVEADQEYTALRIMGIKITAAPAMSCVSSSTSVQNFSAMFGLGLFKATAVEEAAMGEESEQEGDMVGRQVFRRVFARESTIEKMTHDDTSGTPVVSSPAFTSLIQRRVKGHLDIDNGQALYLVSWYQPHETNNNCQHYLKAHIEYSYTKRSYNG